MAITIRQDDPLLVAIKAELLHGIPELTGKQINTAATLALIAVRRGSETSEAQEKGRQGYSKSPRINDVFR